MEKELKYKVIFIFNNGGRTAVYRNVFKISLFENCVILNYFVERCSRYVATAGYSLSNISEMKILGFQNNALKEDI